MFFFLYSKTLSQINLFHDKLVDMQKTALIHISESKGSDAKLQTEENTGGLEMQQ